MPILLSASTNWGLAPKASTSYGLIIIMTFLGTLWFSKSWGLEGGMGLYWTRRWLENDDFEAQRCLPIRCHQVLEVSIPLRGVSILKFISQYRKDLPYT